MLISIVKAVIDFVLVGDSRAGSKCSVQKFSNFPELVKLLAILAKTGCSPGDECLCWEAMLVIEIYNSKYKCTKINLVSSLKHSGSLMLEDPRFSFQKLLLTTLPNLFWANSNKFNVSNVWFSQVSESSGFRRGQTVPLKVALSTCWNSQNLR